MRAHARTYVGTWRGARARRRHVSEGSMAEWRAVPSDLFPFVLAFLRENRFDGAARAFAREAAAVSGGGAGRGCGTDRPTDRPTDAASLPV